MIDSAGSPANGPRAPPFRGSRDEWTTCMFISAVHGRGCPSRCRLRATNSGDGIPSGSTHSECSRKGLVMPSYNKLSTPQDSAVVFIDHQPQMTFGVGNMDRATLINNVVLLAKVAKEF